MEASRLTDSEQLEFMLHLVFPQAISSSEGGETCLGVVLLDSSCGPVDEANSTKTPQQCIEASKVESRSEEAETQPPLACRLATSWPQTRWFIGGSDSSTNKRIL